MPTLSTFYGIKITMNYRDHPPPHFHAEYQEYEATIKIATGEVTGKIAETGVDAHLDVA